MLEQHRILEVSYSSPPLKCFLKEQDLLGDQQPEMKPYGCQVACPIHFLISETFYGVVEWSSVQMGTK